MVAKSWNIGIGLWVYRPDALCAQNQDCTGGSPRSPERFGGRYFGGPRMSIPVPQLAHIDANARNQSSECHFDKCDSMLWKLCSSRTFQQPKRAHYPWGCESLLSTANKIRVEYERARLFRIGQQVWPVVYIRPLCWMQEAGLRFPTGGFG